MGEFKVMLARGSDRLEVEGTADFVEARLEQLLPLLENRSQPDDSGGVSNRRADVGSPAVAGGWRGSRTVKVVPSRSVELTSGLMTVNAAKS